MTNSRPQPAASPLMDAPLNSSQPIGIFDSGIGGLTVVKEVIRQLPNERIIYLGDTARVPYGPKSDRTIKAFTLQSCLFLLEHDVKMIIIACNTASAVALGFIANMFKIPVIGVIAPGSSAALACSTKNRIGIIGTQTTVNSHAYAKTIKEMNAEAEVFSHACSLFVPLAEEGWVDHDVTMQISNEYLKPFEGSGIDTLVLGCTHYPLLSGTIQRTIDRIMVAPVHLIDSGVETAKLAKTILVEKQLLSAKTQKALHKFYVTDMPKNFMKVGERFLGSKMEDIETVNVEILGF